jgi:hypothetical protein
MYKIPNRQFYKYIFYHKICSPLRFSNLDSPSLVRLLGDHVLKGLKMVCWNQLDCYLGHCSSSWLCVKNHNALEAGSVSVIR